MIWFGDVAVLTLSFVALIYGLRILFRHKVALYFQLILCAVACHILGSFFDVCELFTSGTLAEGFTIGYLGSIGCFLFLLTSGFGYMDGILDDRTPAMRKSRLLALLAPLAELLILIPNFLADVELGTKICYVMVWLPVMISSYFHLKHAIIPDMGFGFVRAIRPFNVAALAFSFCQLLHLTVWNFFDWLPIMTSGLLLGISCIVMTVMAEKGVKEWTL